MNLPGGQRRFGIWPRTGLVRGWWTARCACCHCRSFSSCWPEGTRFCEWIRRLSDCCIVVVDQASSWNGFAITLAIMVRRRRGAPRCEGAGQEFLFVGFELAVGRQPVGRQVPTR